jgi:DNA repair exonuclease SbcCD ATPase subunit
MKKYVVFSLMLLCLYSNAQSVKVVKETVRIKGEVAEGFEVQLDGTLDEVQSQLAKYLKAVGKIKKGEDADMISLPLINGKNYTSALYVIARDKGKGAAWLGIRPTEWPSDMELIKAEIEKLTYDFAVAFSREKIQQQIDESMRALQAVERQQQRLLNQQKDYTTRLGENRNEKIQLEKSLENNKLQLESLTKKLEQNKKDQDSVAVAGEQIKKVIEMQKERQRNVN